MESRLKGSHDGPRDDILIMCNDSALRMSFIYYVYIYIYIYVYVCTDPSIRIYIHVYMCIYLVPTRQIYTSPFCMRDDNNLE